MAGEVKGSDNAAGWFFLSVIFFILLAIFWYFFQYDIRAVVRWIRYGEMWMMSHILGDNYQVPWQDSYLPFWTWFEATPNIQKEALSEEVSQQIATTALYPYRWLYSIILGLAALWILFKGPNTQFRKTHNLDTLIAFQSRIFPYIKPFIKFDPSKLPPRAPGSPVPAELPLFAEALGPEEWIAYYEVPVPDGKVDQDVAYRKFAQQLGRPWRGYAHLPDYKQVLLAAFCLKAARKRTESDQMLGDIAECWDGSKGLKITRKLLSRARSTLSNRELCGKTFAECNQHAFENTALMRALLYAREEGGVLSPSQFVWLRGHDRTLWYPLNNLGRQTYHPESLGATAHFRKEKLTQRPILRPKVQGAVESITKYMASEKARPVPSLDYSASKTTRGIKKLKSGKAPKTIGLAKGK